MNTTLRVAAAAQGLYPNDFLEGKFFCCFSILKIFLQRVSRIRAVWMSGLVSHDME